MRNRILHIIIFFSIGFLTSCSRTLTYHDYEEYIRDPQNGLIKEKLINGIRYTVQFRPPELMVNQYIKAYDTISEGTLENLYKQYGKYYYFKLFISYQNKEMLRAATNFQQYSNLMQKMGFGMGKYTSLISSNADTLQLVDFHFARYFGMGKSNDILLVFRKDENQAEVLNLYLKEFGLKTGNVRFKFKTSDLVKVEKKKIKS